MRAVQSWYTGSNPARTKRDMTFTACTSNGLGSVMSIPKLGVDEDIPCGRVKEGPGLASPLRVLMGDHHAGFDQTLSPLNAWSSL